MILRLLERFVYATPEPPKRVRDPTKPMAVICPGFPRSGTESLQAALIRLGYDHTYHGWDIVFDEHNYMPAWIRLCRKKFGVDATDDTTISREEFDALLGHCQAMTDAVTPLFFADLIRAYPEAKVVLNTRRDMDKWHQSAINNLVSINESWSLYLESWTTPYGYWTWSVYQRYIWPYLFRTSAGCVNRAIRKNGKWIYREHIAMVKGLVPEQNLLEWHVEDGWEPLCKFLGKDVPDEPFPRTNDMSEFAKRVENWLDNNRRESRRNVVIVISAVIALAAFGLWKLRMT